MKIIHKEKGISDAIFISKTKRYIKKVLFFFLFPTHLQTTKEGVQCA